MTQQALGHKHTKNVKRKERNGGGGILPLKGLGGGHFGLPTRKPSYWLGKLGEG